MKTFSVRIETHLMFFERKIEALNAFEATAICVRILRESVTQFFMSDIIEIHCT